MDVSIVLVTAEHWEADPRHVESPRLPLIRDRLVANVMIDLEVEARDDSPSGPLYAQGRFPPSALALIRKTVR
jgi:hypothetical protein